MTSARSLHSVATIRPVEASVRAVVEGLGELTGIQPALAQVAFALARYLDEARVGPGQRDQTASVAKELRSTLVDLAGGEADDIRAGQARILATLSAPVRNAAPAGSRDPGAAGR